MPVKDEGTYVDTGTGLYDKPSEPTVHENDGVHLGKVDLKQNKGMVPLKKNEPHTYEKPDHEDKPTPSGAYDWAPPDTHHQWPSPELRNIHAAEDKAAKKPHKK